MPLDLDPVRQRFGEFARERFEAVLSDLADDVSDTQVLGDAQLGVMALLLLHGHTEPITLDPADLVEYLDRRDPECTCPPDLVARGGFRSSCAAHG